MNCRRGPSDVMEKSLFINSFSVLPQDTFRVTTNDYESSPPFACAFARSKEVPYLAVADEMGTLHFLKYFQDDLQSNAFQIRAHQNAILDLAWSFDDQFILAASGDRTISMWDTTTILKTRVFSGSHSSTLKCVQIKPSDPKIFCSAGRDSQIVFWDLRLPTGSAAIKKYTKPISKKKSYRSIQKQLLESVTGLQFLNCSSYLFTACFAPSGEIHLFDVRKESSSLDVYSPDSASKQSFTSITASHSGMLLYGLNTDNQLYEFNTSKLMSGPLRTISQPEFMNKSFYSKSELSPCGRFLLSGASIADAFIWDLDSSGAQSTPVYRLSSHDKEVSCVAWNQSDPGLLATCSDDSTVRIWRADYGQKNSPILQQTQYSKTTEHQVTIKYPLVSNDFSQNITPPLSPINGKNLSSQRSASKINHFFSPSKLCTTSSTNSTFDINKENCK